MVGSGILMAMLAWLGCFHLRANNRPQPWFLRSCIVMTFSGWVATLSGWYLTEIGRQPYLVSGLLKTSDAVGVINAATIASSLLMYIVLYSVLLILFVMTLIYLARK